MFISSFAPKLRRITCRFLWANLIIGYFSATALFGQTKANPPTSQKQSNVRYESIETVCSKRGSQEECSCYVPRIKSALTPSQMLFLRRHFTEYDRVFDSEKDEVRNYRQEHPLDNSSTEAALTVNMLAFSLAVGPATDKLDNALARDMGGADPFYKLLDIDKTVAATCNLGYKHNPTLTWTDPATGLTWPKTIIRLGSKSWKGASDYCRNLNLDGYTGWRLPKLDELAAIANPLQKAPGPDGVPDGLLVLKGQIIVGSLSGLDPDNFMPGFWSSMDGQEAGSAPYYGYEGNFESSFGKPKSFPSFDKNYGFRPLCVRGGSPSYEPLNPVSSTPEPPKSSATPSPATNSNSLNGASATPGSASQKVFRVNSNVMAQQKIEGAGSAGSQSAAPAQRSGKVVLNAVISAEGTVQNLTVISGPPELRQAAMDAVKTWRYRPYLMGGQAVAVNTIINFP